jgi:anti-sigma factor ChrR (cupin superfamily)
MEWERFQKGVDIHWIYRLPQNGPAAAFLRFRPGGRVPLHEHRGFEHILVLSGSQRDNSGELRAGALMVHSPGTRHSVVSAQGCLVLAVYEKPARFLKRARG